MSKGNLLFSDRDLYVILNTRHDSIAETVDSVPQDQFLNTHVEELAECIFSRLKVEPLTLHERLAEMDQQETKIDVGSCTGRRQSRSLPPRHLPGTEVVVTIPYSGDEFLWKLRPNQWRSVFPFAHVSARGPDGSGRLQLAISERADEAPKKFKDRLDQEMKSIRFYVEEQRRQIEQFNAGLMAPIRAAVVARRERLKKHEGIKDLLGIPLKQRDGTPPIDPIRIARKLARPLPPPPKAGYQPEPGITDKDYGHILSVIRHVGRTFEATPRIYEVHNEEELRGILLAHLNGHYEGSATGETFRRSGKTDIRIEDQARAAFIAECKVWRGQKELSAAIDQLLGYLTWRDCKTALIIFNKHNAKFTELVGHVPGIFQAHGKFRQLLGQGEDGDWEFLMTSREDDARHVRVHVFVFNLYAG